MGEEAKPIHSAEPATPVALADAGYFTSRLYAPERVICDAGPLGPDHQLGHAHADFFSFELSLHGRRVIVDAGTFDYERSAMRQYCRSVAAHNTVQIGDAEPAELWAAFRIGRRGRPHEVRFDREGLGFRLSAWHDGYWHLSGRPTHRRTFHWHEGGTLLIHDHVSRRGDHGVRSRLHIHPDWRVTHYDGTQAHLVADRTIHDDADTSGTPPPRATVTVSPGATLALKTAPYCPRFGESLPAPVLVFNWASGVDRHSFAITPDGAPASLNLDDGLRCDGQTYTLDLP